MRVMHAAPQSLGATLVSTAIDLDGNHARCVGNLGLEFAEPVGFGSLVPSHDQLAPIASVSRPTWRPLIARSASNRSVREANSNDGSTAPA
jgi:hypothetical protein